MLRISIAVAAGCVFVVLLVVILGVSQYILVPHGPNQTTSTSSTFLIPDTTVRLPEVAGRIDHMDYDPLYNRLFVAEFGNNSVAVIDLNSNRVVRVLTGFDEPQGVLYVPGSHQLFVSNGGTGVVDIYNATSFELRGTIRLASDADNLRLESRTQQVYVGFGQGNNSGIAIINGSDDAIAGIIPLPGHPEAFQLEQNGSRIFVNVPVEGAVYVFDRTTKAFLGAWPLPGYVANFPMGLDESDHRLFVGTWSPPKFVVFSTDTGKPVSNLTISENADDLYFEANLHMIYISCASGFLDIVRQATPDDYSLVGSIPTSAGARTSLLVPDPPRLFLAVPSSGGSAAEIEVFGLKA